MNAPIRLSTLSLIVFCLYLFWGSFGLDITLHPGVERLPFHRAFIAVTGIIFLVNLQNVFFGLSKNKLLIALIFYVLLSAAWASSPSTVVKNVVFVGSALIISVITASAFAENRIGFIKRLFWLFFIMTLASVVTAVYLPRLGINIKDFGRPRWIGITAHPNALGTQALTLIWLSVNLFALSKSTFEKMLTVAAICVGFFAIIKADSMTSLLASFVVILCVGYFYKFNQLATGLKVIFIGFGLIGFLFVITFYINASDLADATLKTTGRDATFSGRAYLWKAGFSAVANNFLLGYGFDDLSLLTKKYHIQMSHLHNGYIETLVKGGAIAALLLATILLKTYFKQLKIKAINKPEFIFLNSGFIMILVHNFAESSILRGLSTLNVILIYLIVSTSLFVNNKPPQIE